MSAFRSWLRDSPCVCYVREAPVRVLAQHDGVLRVQVKRPLFPVYARLRNLRHDLAALPSGVPPWLAARRNAGRYRLLDEEELRRTRCSDRIFVFGSGASLNDLTSGEIAHLEEHDTLGFNWFVRQRFVRCDYHLIRGIPDTDFDADVWRPQLAEYFSLLSGNPLFARTVYLVQTGFRATNGNRALGFELLPQDARVFLWRTRDSRDPSRSFAFGLSHGHSTLHEAINFAFLLGWRRIVLVGVDLYDRRYFWLSSDEARSVDAARGAAAGDVHSVARSLAVADLGRWRELLLLLREGVELEAYNPRSLLAAVMPVYERAPEKAR